MVQLCQVLWCSGQQLFKPRTSFSLKNRTVLHWFPGHMGKGVKDMQKKLKVVDCVIEVHDARIPLSGRHPESFQTITGLRPHILVYNKRDLADSNFESIIKQQHNANGFKNVIFTNCRENHCQGVKKLIPMVQNEIKNACRYNRSENQDYCLMIIGVPNVGKSSLINVLRKRHLLKSSAAHVGAKPGITTSVGEKIKISDDPLIYVLDTPGILTPKVPTVDDGMKLALCNTIPDKEVGIDLVADYCLYWLNKHGYYSSYFDFFDTNSPSNEISELLASFAVKNNLYFKTYDANRNKIVRPNLHLAAVQFVEAFRIGLFGRLTLDIDKINSVDSLNKKSHIITRKSSIS